MKKDRKTDKNALELKMAKLRLLTTDELAMAGGGNACTYVTCGSSCKTSETSPSGLQ
jgi:hypothetical protein